MSVTIELHAQHLQQEIARVDWYHIMDLGNGITTPGRIACMSPEQLEIGRLDGQTVLDIGAWDGAYSFMAERRGARRVVATDSVVWSGAWRTGNAGFKLARRVLKSRVEDKIIDGCARQASRCRTTRGNTRTLSSRT